MNVAVDPVLLTLAERAFEQGGLPTVVAELWARHEALMAKERAHGRRLLAMARKPATTCPTCDRTIGVSRHGRLATHYEGDSTRRCSGTGQFPKEGTTSA